MVIKKIRQKTELFVLDQIKKKMHKYNIKENPENKPLINQLYKDAMGRNMINIMKKKIINNDLNPNVKKVFAKVFTKSILFGSKEAIKFKKRHGRLPPKFITIAPLVWCNLKCKGCYANACRDALLAQGKSGSSWIDTGEHVLDFNLLNKIVNELKKRFGMRFFVITGGEPLFYRNHGYDIYDFFAQHKDCYFLMYTNGILLAQEENVKKLAKLGNVTPAISIEGFEKETDARRGKGVYKLILKAFDNLKKYKLIFGLSFTITRQNVDVLLDSNTRRKFIDFYFKEIGASYMWGFQYMPIGRGVNFNRIITPEQRAKLVEIEKDMIFKDGIFFADFWNSAFSSDGCISAARPGGYFYIDWDGYAYTCAFDPFLDKEFNNIKRHSIIQIINSRYFRAKRKWINEYGYTTPPQEMKNQYAPCPIRDHFVCKNCMGLKNMAKETGAITSDPKIRKAMFGKRYSDNMQKISDRYKELTEKKWEKARAIDS